MHQRLQNEDKSRPRRVLVVGQDNSIRYLDDKSGDFDDEGRSSVRRVSHIYPRNWGLFLAFVFIRVLFGDDGGMAEWTRNWKCAWVLDMRPSGGAKISGFSSRQAAIDFEVNSLNSRLAEGDDLKS